MPNQTMHILDECKPMNDIEYKQGIKWKVVTSFSYSTPTERESFFSKNLVINRLQYLITTNFYFGTRYPF